MKGKRITRKVVALALITLLTLLGGTAPVGSAGALVTVQGDAMAVTITRTRIVWQPLIENGGIVLTISGPGVNLQETYAGNARITFRNIDKAGNPWPDGTYSYEFKLLPINDGETQPSIDDAERGLVDVSDEGAMVYSGAFTISGGYFVPPEREETTGTDIAEPQPGLDSVKSDVLHYDDVIITGSLCVGFDCANGESFGYCTVKLKENNLQLCFEDTSVGSFPTNDWKIQINDTTSGGASYFTLWDTNGGRRPFTIEAGAPAHSLYVEDYGRVGLGTSIPYVELHVVDGDSPTIRLDQDGSSGWTPQRWDMCGNETNFFIRDVTNGSKLSFRIQPNTPSNTLALRSTGYVGIGTWSPAYTLEVEETGENAVVGVQRTSGATGKFSATTNKVVFGAVTNHKVTVIVDETTVAEFDTAGDLTITDGDVNANAFNPTSDVNAKENFAAVDGKEVLARLENVDVTTWNFKGDDARHIGPTAQDFYAVYGLGADDKHISTTDADGVALVAIKELNAQNKALEAENAALRSNVSDLETRMAALEAGNGAASADQPLLGNVLLIVGLLVVGVILGLGLSVSLIWMARRGSGSSLLTAG